MAEKKARSSAAHAKGNGKQSRISKAVKTTSSRRGAKSQFFTAGGNISEFYRPLKKPVTLRLDADVIAWFKKDGKRYQTRINVALRKVMEREMKAAG